MKSLSKKIFVTLLALIMFLSVGFVCAQNSNVFAASAYDTDINGRDAISQADFNGLTNQMKMLQINSAIETWEDRYLKYKEKEEKDHFKKEIKKREELIKNINSAVSAIVDIGKIINSDDFDEALFLDTVISFACDIAPAFAPYGAVVGAAVECVWSIFKTCMGGESATSEMAQMEDRLNQQFDDIQNKLSDIEEQISEISNQINESTDKIINSTITALDNANAKQYLREFMLSSGKGDFSYNQYHNYIYGSSTNNANARTAYNAKLKQALANDASDNIIKSYYDKLYEELTANQDTFRNYIAGSNNEDSIIKKYYQTVSANTNLLKETGDTPEVATIKFAYDLYQTYIEADMIMLGCNIYQYRKMLETNTDFYDYTGRNDFVELIEIQNNSILNSLLYGEDEIYKQIVSDVAYVCGITESYMLENNGKFYEISDNGNSSFGNITSEQTVYLNGMPDSVCELFGFNSNDFVYYLDGEQINGIIKNKPIGQYSLTFKFIYNQEKNDAVNVGNITLKVSEAGTIANGSGTIEDPYLISNIEQFLNIKNDLSKHYKLIDNIDFNGAEISPIGYSLNGNYSESYKEFTGSFDGNGFKLRNFNIVGESYTGLFAKIGLKGIVKNITLENVKSSSTISTAKSSVSNYYIGSVCGLNNGTVSNCQITSGNSNEYGVFFELNNSVHNRNIAVYAGGVSGINNAYISACKVEGVSVKGTSIHDFGGDATSTNRNNVYVGGLTGANNAYIGYSAVMNTVKLNAYAKSIYNPQTTVRPYVTSFAGGICGQENNNYQHIEKVFTGIDATNISAVAELKCQSNWGKYYDNVKTEKSTYIPYISETIKNAVSVSYAEIENVFGSAETEFAFEYKNGSNYCRFDNATPFFNTDGIILKVDGQAIDSKNITVVRVYGFNGFNAEFKESDIATATVLLLVRLANGQSVLTKQAIRYVVGANEIQSIEILGAKTTFYTDDDDVVNKAILGATAKLTYTVGEKDETITADNFNEFSVNGLNVSTPIDFTKLGKEKEIRTFTVTYKGVESNAVEYVVLCEHNRSQVEHLHQVGEPVAATCVSRGYTVYHCDICDCDVYKNYTPIDPYAHVVHYDDCEDATCYEEGKIGRIYCELCNHTFEKGYTIPKKSHKFTRFDDIYHYCENIGCIHYESHQYTITESVEYRYVENETESGWQYVLVYNYVCQGCGYSKQVVDLNANLEANNDLPQVVITQGYALHGGDEVVVYVQLVNNPGIYGANFGIRYDSGLKLIGYEDGPVLENSMVANSSEVDNGCNFVWANGDGLRKEDGNLVKLTFRMPYDYQENQTFKIWVVYDLSSAENDPFNGEISITLDEFNNNYKADGGFATSKEETQLFITESGLITFVKHLPGDINNDGVVDMLDAVILGKDLVKNKEGRKIEKDLGDLNLNNGVGIDDLVSLLIHLTGGYNENGVYAVRNPNYRLVLNLNGAELSNLIGIEELNDLFVSIYGDLSNKTYSDFGLEILSRNGYKFLGWYDKPYGGNSVDINSDVRYNYNQKVQTLYAQWEINHITFDGNGATSGQMDDVYYNPNGNEMIVNCFEQEYSVLMRDTDSGNDNKAVKGNLVYEIVKWQDKNGNEYLLNEIDLSLPDLGELELFAVWDEGHFSYDLSSWNIYGHNISKWLKVEWKDLWNLSQYTIDITDNESIKNFVTEQGQNALLYADVTPITYTIRFYGDGNTNHASLGEETNHYFGNDVQLNSNVYEKVGYAFKGWKCVINNKEFYFNDREVIGYIEGVKQGDVVTFTAQWKAVSFTISLDGNYKNVTDGWNNKASLPLWDDVHLEYDQSNNLCLPSVENQNGLIFKGWDTGENGTGTRFTSGQELTTSDLNNLYQKYRNGAVATVTLYAVWDVDPYIISEFVSNEYIVKSLESGKTYKVYKDEFPRWVENEYQIIDVRNNKDATVWTDLFGETWIIGNPDYTYTGSYFCFTDISEGNTRTVHVKDFKFASSTTVGALCTYSGTSYNNCNGGNIVIDIHGDCAISMSNAGCNAIMLAKQNITFIGDGSLIIKAGNGANGSNGSGANGGNGGTGITANSVTVDVIGTLIVYGGNGGNGGSGVTGSKGWVLDYGGDGDRAGKGDDGGTGGNGGDGGWSIHVATQINLIKGNLALHNGSGGNGGQGGAGGDGGDAVTHGIIICGWAGHGGNGGQGGRGGSNPYINAETFKNNGNITVYNGVSGVGGTGGAAGAAGSEKSAFDHHGDPGQPGSSGGNGVRITNSYVIIYPIIYKKHTYQFINENLSWMEAKARAEELGGHLVIINSADEENAIVAAMRSQGLKRMWIGLSDAEQEGTFKWVDGKVAYYTDFNYGQPDNYNNAEHYFEICVDIQPQVYWNDVPLQYDANQGFIIEFEPDYITYNGHTYQLIEETLTWKEAKAKAEELGGHLATITSAEENSVLKNMVEQSGLSNVWLGGTDSATEGTTDGNWKWVTDEEFLYSDWGKIDSNSSEPNGGTNENYLAFWTGYIGGNGIAWNDASGTGKYSFIVEFE